MTDALHLLDTPECGAVAILTGVLAGESDREIRIRVADGTWTFRRGDVLAVQPLDDRTDGHRVRVEIRAGSQAELIRIAWHLGNRHLPTQLLPDALRIRTDHVIEEMVRGLGGSIAHVEAPFDPEGGAYGHSAVHGHAHG